MSVSVLNHFVERCFLAFVQQGISYGIMRNAEEVERGDAHDIDLVVNVHQLRAAENSLFRIAEQEGWKLLFRTGASWDRYNIKCYNFYTNDADGSPVLAHIDIFPAFAWESYILLDNEYLMQNLDTGSLYHRISPIAEVVSKLFVRLLYNGAVKRKYIPHIEQVFSEQPEEAIACMKRFLSEALSRKITDMVCQRQWNAIDALRPQIVADIKRFTERYRWTYWAYRVRKAMRPIGIVAAFQGTDGSGKTTIIDALPHMLGSTWPEGAIRYFHCRPYVLEPDKQEKTGTPRIACPNPHEKKPYGTLKSFAKLCYCIFDYIIGWCGPIYWERAKGHMVVFDRYYYDFYLDKLRYRFHLSDDVLRLMQRFVPKPDVTFVLTGDAEPIWARKQELSLGEVQQQIELLEKHQHLFAHPYVINVVQPIETVVNTVCTALLEAQQRRFLRLFPGKEKTVINASKMGSER